MIQNRTQLQFNRVTVRVDWRVQWRAVVDMVTNHTVPIKVDSILNKMHRCKHTVTGLVLLSIK